jgi:hypothetical protein
MRRLLIITSPVLVAPVEPETAMILISPGVDDANVIVVPFPAPISEVEVAMTIEFVFDTVPVVVDTLKSPSSR